MLLSSSLLEQVLDALGALLAERGVNLELVAAGGSGLLLLGLVTRTTRDLDILALVDDGRFVSAEPLPASLVDAANDVGTLYDLPPDWLNSGPTSVLDFGLPEGFADRVHTRTFTGLTIHIASRVDQICLKLHATADQGPRSKHADDLRRLDPAPHELLFAARWTLTQDPSPGFRRVLLEALHAFGVGDADEAL